MKSDEQHRAEVHPTSDQVFVFPASFAQQRLWFLEQLERELVAYNLPFAVRLRGRLDAESLRRALETIVQRHEPLRTTFRLQDGEPLQIIQPPSRFDLPLVDLVDLLPDLGAAEVTARRRGEAERPFDLSADLMLRASLLRLADEEHVLLLTLHHIAADGWSLQVLWQELATAYAAFRRNEEPALDELPIQYADYAVWQRNELQGERLERLLAYWRKQLAGLGALELPTDHPRPPKPSYQGACHAVEVPRGLVDQLRQLSRREGTTLHMTLLAAFQALLARYSGQEDVAVGVPIAGRQQAELEPLIGFFVNTLVLRTELSGAPTFRELLARVRQVSLEAYDHQDLPFERLVEKLNPERHLSRHPLFQVTFQLLELGGGALALPELEVLPLAGASERVRFDLEMHLWAHAEGLRGSLVYSTDLFEPETIARLLGHYLTLLGGIVADPDQQVGQLPLLTAEERQQVLVEWNDTRREYPCDQCLHQLFEDQAARTPEAVAVICENQQLTYAELNERANQLARDLRSLAVGPDVLVGLCLERSLDLVVALLGTLKAGGAYVPLDPAYPRERLAFMLQDARTRVLLSHRKLREQLPDGAAHVVCLDREEPQRDGPERGMPPPAGVQPGHLAYVLYTSGSTGQPKGAMIPHRAIVNHMRWMQERFPVGPDDVVLQKTPCSFDASVWEFFLPLMSGARLVLARPDGHRDVAYLIELIQEHRVTVAQFVPSLLEVFLQHPGAGLCRSLRRAFCGGEALTAELCRRFQGCLSAELVNLYGPTEAAIDTVFWPCGPQDSEAAPPLGRPVANTQVYVLDPRLEPVPVGVPGELYIGGAQVGRGYVNRRELTEERFVSNPFDRSGASRLYRTGDRVRWRCDGTLEFLGRFDDQVKLRGYRIELGEIESVLKQHPAVAQAVVMLREDRAGDKRLVGYYVPSGEGAVSHPELTRHLRGKVPEYMVPASWVELPRLPLTPNGKVDRRALPAPEEHRPDLSTAYAAPRDPVEEQLAAIWAEVLGLGRVGIHDNFFDLGGHSLLATQVVARANSVLDVDLALRRLFETPTIAGLAAEIRVQRAGGRGRAGPGLARFPRDDGRAIPLSFAQQRLWFLEQLERELVAYHMPFAVRLRGRLDVESLRCALETIVQRHEALRTVFRLQEGTPVQVVQPPPRFDLPLVDLGELPPEQRAAEVTARRRGEAERPFDLSADLMLRASLLRLADEEHVLLLTLHHIAADGWSLQVLWRELATAYAAYRRTEEPALDELPIQYADYAVWQRNELQGERLERLLAYWRKQLAGLGALELPTDHPRPPQPSYQGASHDFEVPRALVDQLRRLSRSEGTTLHMTLLAAFQTLLARYSGQEDVPVGLPIAGRQQAELEPLIGFFVNTLVLRTELSGVPTFRELLARVRQVSLEAYDHQDLPFEKLVEELNPERHLSRHPLFQVTFQLLEFGGGKLALPELEVLPLAGASERVRFDLEVHLWAHAEGLRGSLVYSTDLFQAATIARLVGHYLTLLGAIVADPDTRIDRLPLLSEAERRQVLVEGNATPRDYPRDKCVHELFEEQAVRTPGAVAAVCEGGQLTYGELNSRANQWARHLQRWGVGPEVPVGLCVERSLEMVVGLLAILKAGGAYVPLDPHYPSERLRLLVEDTRVPVVLTQQELLPSLPLTAARVTCLDRDAGQVATESPENLPCATTAENLAYVVYTSGSTGVPKGVCIPHRGVVRLVQNTDYARFGPDEVFLQFSPLSFDAATFEIWGCLLHGARLVIFPPGWPAAVELGQTIQDAGVTTLWLTAGLFQEMVDQQLHRLRGLRQLLAGGDVLSVPHVQRALRELPGCTIINGYGPTENTTFSCCYPMRHVDQVGRSVPIGRPIANTEAYVLDRHLQPVPVGVPGELYLGGDGLARGYLHLPELTAERFLPHPFRSDQAARVYRTGDWVRWLPDGNLEFIGRMDQQVKIRGFRVELGEVEAVLGRHPGLSQCAVVAREDLPGHKRLAAYAVAVAPGRPPTSEELRGFVRQQLPEFMVPAVFTVLPKLPLTPHGKVDRQTLSAAPLEGIERKQRYVSPSDPSQLMLRQLWEELLGLPHIGVRDDFFEWGGNSLLAVRMLGRVEELTGVRVPVAALFAEATIESLARLLLDAQRQQQESPLVEVQAGQPGGARSSFGTAMSTVAGSTAGTWRGTSARTSRSTPSIRTAWPGSRSAPRSKPWLPTICGCCASISRKARTCWAGTATGRWRRLKSRVGCARRASKSTCW